MSNLTISYPISSKVLSDLSNYKEIAKHVKVVAGDRSELEIIRVLGNSEIACFINKFLPSSGNIGEKLLEQTDIFEFGQHLAELYLFGHLQTSFGDRVVLNSHKKNSAINDMDVNFDGTSVKFEVYTPIELAGFQILAYYIKPLLFYLDVPHGFCLNVQVDPRISDNEYDQDSFYYPYSVPEKNQVLTWLSNFKDSVKEWLIEPNPSETMSLAGPGGKVVVNLELRSRNNNIEDRFLGWGLSTRSNDTILYFRNSGRDIVNSEWGRKLMNKLREQQCGTESPNTMRILVLNFALADTPHRELISYHPFTRVFEELILILVSGGKPYDIVLPARLGVECCFGKPVFINSYLQNICLDFIEKAKLQTPCAPYPEPSDEEFDKLIGFTKEEKEEFNRLFGNPDN